MVKARHLVRILIVLVFVALLAVPTAAQETSQNRDRLGRRRTRRIRRGAGWLRHRL